MSKSPKSEPVNVTPELKSFCSGVADLYETVANTPKSAEVDWWYGFGKDVEVNLFVEEGRIIVCAYKYDGNLVTRSCVKVVDRKFRRKK